MAPRINPRKHMGLAKDIQALLRCRNAVAIDTSLNAETAKRAINHIDEAVAALNELKREMELRDRESGELPKHAAR